MRYADVETFVSTGLNNLGYGAGSKPMPVLDPGPWAIEGLRKRTPGSMIFLVLGNGTAQTTEGLYDRPFITVRVIGPQKNFAAAEALAYDVDRLLLAVAGNGTLGSARVLYVTRTGGPPQLVDFDGADRYHFQTTYITEVQYG